MSENSYPIDVAYNTRQSERDRLIREAQDKQNKIDKEKYYKLKIEYDQLVQVNIPSVEQEQERINQELGEPPAIDQESRLQLAMFKAFTYTAFALTMGFAGILLILSILTFVFFSFSEFTHWLIAFACISLTVVGFHWAVRSMGPKMRKVLIFFLLLITIGNIGAWSWIRAEYSSVAHLQETEGLTAEQAKKKMKMLDGILIFVHITFALAVEGIAALCASRAVELFEKAWPGWAKYRRRRFWERVYAAQLKQKIALENQMHILQPNQTIESGVNHEFQD